MQLKQLRAYAKRRNMRVVAELFEVESGAKKKRPKLEKLMDLAHKREIDVVLVWKFDRFARSTKQLIVALEVFRSLHVDFISYTENVDTTTPHGEALFKIIGVFAELERSFIRQRVKAGLQVARKKGKRLGRPPIDPKIVADIRRLRRKHYSYSEISEELAIPRSTVVKHGKKTPRRRTSSTRRP
jgi:DNA invertase Pin-like site-specific DNA recombinase